MRLAPGHAHRLGASVEPGGVNFALAAPNARAVELCLFDEAGIEQRWPLQACVHGVWHGFMEGAGVGQIYGWRVHGPWEPQAGHRFNPCKLLLDPYAREVLGRYQGEDVHLGHLASEPMQRDTRDNAAVALKARVVADLPVASRCAPVDPARRVIYELHVKGFTASHPEIPAELRGSYAALAHPAAIKHLKSLGVTTLCLMPVAFRADEVRLLKLGLSNYWGYSPIAWSAPESRYWSGQTGTTARSEFRQMMEALHAAGFEVILDVVYNHTAETDELGPTLSLRGIDNATYYHLDGQKPQHYLNLTGCGNTLNLQHALVLRTVMDSLRTWVHDFGADGFRFDLAPVLARGGAERSHAFSVKAPFLMAVAQDPILRNLLMVAEPWDIGWGGYQLGQFPPGWLEWNDRFRDTQRAFWLLGRGDLGGLAYRLAGSADLFAPVQRAPFSSVNFVTAHDGFTLADLVAYQERHNLENGEANRDGHADNLSHNHGVEGPTDDPHIVGLRLKKKRALLAVTVFSLGTPMLLAGDDIGHSQQGNNNAYCQDNSVTWLNWQQADPALHRFVARLIQARQVRSALQSQVWWKEDGAWDPQAGLKGPSAVVARWLRPDGEALSPADWHSAQAKAFVLHLSPQPASTDPLHAPCLILFNASHAALRFTLPAGRWICHLETDSGHCRDKPLSEGVDVPAGSVCLASAALIDNAAESM